MAGREQTHESRREFAVAGSRKDGGERWVRKLLMRLKTDGDGVAVHGLRCPASNRRIEGKMQARAIQLLKQPEWHDFGPTFGSEQLGKRHSIHVGIASYGRNSAKKPDSPATAES